MSPSMSGWMSLQGMRQNFNFQEADDGYFHG
jgi:hypothetical protein